MQWILDLVQRFPLWVMIAMISHFAILGGVAYLILLERKVASWVQDRIGPNRVGLDFGLDVPWKGFHFWGLGQPLADGIKFLVKEDYRPKGVDKVLFTIAPALMIVVVIVSIVVIPWGGVKQTTRTVDLTADLAGVAKSEWVAKAAETARWRLAYSEVPVGGVVIAPGQATPLAAEDARKLAAPQELAKLPAAPTVPPGTVIRTFTDPATGVLRTEVDVTYRWAFQPATLNIGLLFVVAVLSLAVYGIVLGGWASNSKYSFFGGLRATAQMISYEIPMGLCILTVVVMFGTLELGEIVDKQAHLWLGFIPAWNVFAQPIAFFLFLVCIHAEANRAPFDMAEAEQELVGGYHTEYSSMRFALFFLAEYAGMITTSAILVALFFGGWHMPGISSLAGLITGATTAVDPTSPAVTTSLVEIFLRVGVFATKIVVVIFVFMWVRWSLPRFRFDQLMDLAWRALIPLSLAVMVVTAVIVFAWGGQGRVATMTDPLVIPMSVPAPMALILFLANIAIIIGMALLSVLLPAPPDTNRRVGVRNSRFRITPLPAGLLGGVKA